MNNDASDHENGINVPNISDDSSEEDENEFANWANGYESIINDDSDVVFEDESIDDNEDALLFHEDNLCIQGNADGRNDNANEFQVK